MCCLTEGLQCVLDFVTVNIINFSDINTNTERKILDLNYVLHTSFLRYVEVLIFGAFMTFFRNRFFADTVDSSEVIRMGLISV